VVLVADPGNTWGGPLLLLDLRSGRMRRLTPHQYWGKKEKGQVEVYADPAFSPDGKRVVFAIRDYYPGSDRNNAVDDAGPLATVDLRSGRVRILTSTLNVDGQGVAFSNSPRWSPDGRRILVSFEVGASITSAHGVGLQQLTDVMDASLKPVQDDELGSTALDWVGNECVVYAFFSGKAGSIVPDFGLRILHLKASKIGNLADVAQLPATALDLSMPGTISWCKRTPMLHSTMPGPAAACTLLLQAHVRNLSPRRRVCHVHSEPRRTRSSSPAAPWQLIEQKCLSAD